MAMWSTWPLVFALVIHDGGQLDMHLQVAAHVAMGAHATCQMRKLTAAVCVCVCHENTVVYIVKLGVWVRQLRWHLNKPIGMGIRSR